jgi:hypothetical protein
MTLSFKPFAPLVAALTLITGFPLAAAALTAPEGEQAAALFPPTWSRARILAAVAEADARLVRYAGAPGLAVVEIEPARQNRLIAAGAWIIADPVLAGGCFTETVSKTAPLGAAYARSVS